MDINMRKYVQNFTVSTPKRKQFGEDLCADMRILKFVEKEYTMT
jgi:hypothetical protein